MTPTVQRSGARARVRSASGWGQVVAALLLVLVVGVWGGRELLQVRSQADEYAWLRAHGLHTRARVVEVGTLDRFGRPSAVWVLGGSSRQFFIDLTGSRQPVAATGSTLSVVLDSRLAPATGVGVPVDALERRFRADYLRALALPGVVLVLGMALLATWERRRHAPSVTHDF